ncbi:MAG: adenine phosphoribosyltransferase [Candidatus Ornithospirochaeta sp.]
MKSIEEYIRTIPDFPKKGILFRDITAALEDRDGLRAVIDSMEEKVKLLSPTVVAGAESRGFLLGMPIAYNLSLPFLPVRKKGKLPCTTIEESYSLEYGEATVEVDVEGIKEGDRVVLIDDLMATGGTMKAAARLVERLGGTVAGIVVLIELVDLKGREVLSDYRIESVIKYEGD